MALGNNMKKSAGNSPKKEEAKKPVKKKLISKSKTPKKKVNKPKKAAVTRRQGNLENYISSQKEARRSDLRKRYNSELEELVNKELQFLVFEIGRTKYAIEIDRVREVATFENMSPTPQGHSHLPGIITFRGRTFVGLDLAKKFGVEDAGDFNFSVVLKHINRVALLLPKIPSSVKVSGSLIQPLNDLVVDASLDEVYVKGLFQYQSETIYYLDLGELIRSDKAIVVPDELING